MKKEFFITKTGEEGHLTNKYHFTGVFPPWMAIIDIRRIDESNVHDLKEINLILFPVRYNTKFYKDACELGPYGLLGTMKLYC